MALANRGFGGSFGVGFESAWGTAVARTNWLRYMNNSLKRMLSKESLPHLGSYGQASTNQRYHYIKEDFAGGTLEWPFAYDDSSVAMLRAALGTNATTGVGPYVHTATLSSPLTGTGNPLTIEVIHGTPASGGGNMGEVFEGCLINQFDLSVESGGVMMASAEIIAETSGGLASAGSPTYSSNGNPVLHNHFTSCTFNSTTRALRSFKVSFNRNLERNHELGSLFTAQPVENRLRVEFELQMLWQSADWRTEWLADTQGDMVVVFTGSGSNAMTMTLHNAIIEDVSDPVNSAGGIMRTVKGCTYADASDQGLAIAVTNGNSLATAN